MGNMGETVNPLFGEEWIWDVSSQIGIIAVDNELNMVKLPNVYDDPGGVAADKDDDNAKEDEEHIDLPPELPLRTKWFGFQFSQVTDDLGVDGGESEEWNDDSGEQTEVSDVELDVVAVLP